jgi:hypothetical protein
VHNALFTDTISKDQIIGPIKIDKYDNMFLKIEGWTESLVISETDFEQRWNDVVEKVTDIKAWADYEKIVAGLMRGKSVEFDPYTFEKLKEAAAKVYCLRKNRGKNSLKMNYGIETILPKLY